MDKYKCLVKLLKANNFGLALKLLVWIDKWEDRESEQFKKFIPYLPALKIYNKR